jgi:hypothetical protein
MKVLMGPLLDDALKDLNINRLVPASRIALLFLLSLHQDEDESLQQSHTDSPIYRRNGSFMAIPAERHLQS